MAGNVFHVTALGEQITNITKTGITGNLRNSLLIYSNLFRNLSLGPSKAAQTDNNAVSICFLPGTNICNPCVDGLLADTKLFCQGGFSISAFRV